MTHRADRVSCWWAYFAASIALAACVQAPDSTTQPGPTLVDGGAQATPTEPSAATPESTAVVTGTPIPSIWPLAADLYYLTDQGQLYRQPYEGPEAPAVLISPPDQKVSDFAVAPGGEWLLVRADETITASSLEGKGTQEIATGTGAPEDASRGHTMDWSRDASKIAYTTPDGFQIYAAAGAGLQPYVYAIPTPGTYVIDFQWSVESSWLRARTDNQSGVACDVSDPALLKCQALDALTELMFENTDLPGAPPEIATAGIVKSFAWGDPPPRRVSSVPLPNSLYFVGPDAGLMQVWRLASGADAPDVLTHALADVTAYDISPDGSKVTYTSGGSIFVQTIGADDARQIVLLDGGAHSPTGTPKFSPTGRRVAFANNGLFVFDTQTDKTIRLIPDSAPDAPAENARWYDQPRYSPDSNWMLARLRTAQSTDVVVLPSGGTGISATPLHQPNANAEWSSNSQILVYSDGSAFGLGQVNRFPAFRPRTPDVIAAAPAVDVQERPDGRLAMLVSPAQLPFGPSTVRVFSILPDGSDVQAETDSLVIEKPLLSLDAVLIAGLIQTQALSDGTVVGQLVIVNPATQQTFLIDGMEHVQALIWGK